MLFPGGLYENEHSAGLRRRDRGVLLEPELDAGGDQTRVPQRGHLQGDGAGGEQPRVRRVISVPARDM